MAGAGSFADGMQNRPRPIETGEEDLSNLIAGSHAAGRHHQGFG